MPKLTNCKDCGHTVSKRASICPNCGVKKPARQQSLLAAFVICVFVMWFVLDELSEVDMPSGADQEQVSDTRREMNAQIIARREVKKQLVAQSTAEFSASDMQVGLLRGRGPNVWIGKGYVDVQNSYGAMIRSKYEVVIEFQAGSNDLYKVEDVAVY